MTDAIIVEHLAKRYRIGAGQPRYHTLRDRVATGLMRLVRRRRSPGPPATIWALQDVSFRVRRGEVLGIIGRNGAGKSTLLKILSRITEPTAGRAAIRGRLGSLLEVGTGFHQELTGRENILLNGAILGMKKSEIQRKFDEIVTFAGVERFIDTPVKHYSSGMSVRLAFAVAAHLDTDILIIDEVLAVGDVAFQHKCIGKMDEVIKEGRTVLLVSHNLGTIESLCSSAIWLDEGQIAAQGPASEIVPLYLSHMTSNGRAARRVSARTGTDGAQILEARLFDSQGLARDVFQMGETLVVDFSVEFHRAVEVVDLGLKIRRVETGAAVAHMVNQDSGLALEGIEAGKRGFRVEIPGCLLYPGTYTISLWVGGNGRKLDAQPDILAFSMAPGRVSGRTTPYYSHLGMVHVPSVWSAL